jgi:hypothetical protein
MVRLITSSNLVGQLDRQIARLFALEDTAGVDARQAMVLVGIRSIAHESARGSELASREERGNSMTCRQHDKLLRAGEEERIGREIFQRTLIAGIRSPKPVRFWLLQSRNIARDEGATRQ